MGYLEKKNRGIIDTVEEIASALVSPARYLREKAPELADGLNATVISTTATFVLSKKPVLSIIVGSAVGVGTTIVSRFIRK